jgi:uncharacterized membrane protein
VGLSAFLDIQFFGGTVANQELWAILTSPLIKLPDTNAGILITFRWIHFVAGITWIGLLYFFNLVNTPFMKELDAGTRAKVIPLLMPRALWWFRMSAVITVLAGLLYFGNIVALDARNGGASSGPVMGTFFGIWTVTWALMYAILIPGKGLLDKWPVLAILDIAIVFCAAWLFLSLNSHGWESNRLLSIGLGGGIGWMMMLNVWGVIWRIQKRIIQWTKESAANGTPMPEKSKRMMRMAFVASRTNAFLSLPLLFFMGAASHYPMFGR